MTYPPLGPPSPGAEQWPYQSEPQNWPGPDGPPRRRNKWLWASLALAVVVILVLSGVVIGQMTGGDPEEPIGTAAPQPTAMQPQPQQPQQPQPTAGNLPSMTCDGYTVQLDATSPPGWKPTIGKRGLAYAAPPDWDVKACGVQLGWQKPCPDGQQGVCALRAMSAAATLPRPSCGENSNFAMSGVAGSKLTDIKAALTDETRTVPLIYTSATGQAPTVSLGPVREFTIGSAPAVQMVATVTGIAATECTSPDALHSMVATTVPNVEGTVIFIISLRQGVDGAPNPDVINEMVATLRGAG